MAITICRAQQMFILNKCLLFYAHLRNNSNNSQFNFLNTHNLHFQITSGWYNFISDCSNRFTQKTSNIFKKFTIRKNKYVCVCHYFVLILDLGTLHAIQKIKSLGEILQLGKQPPPFTVYILFKPLKDQGFFFF